MLIVLVGVGCIAAAWVADTSLLVRWIYIGAFSALLVAFVLWSGWSFVSYGVHVCILLATLIPWGEARIAIVAVNIAIAAVAAASGETTPLFIALIGSIVLSTGAGTEAGRIGARLHRAEQRVSALALTEEPERIGRNLHGILGHSLTAISIRADLAEKLIERGPAAARVQIAELSVIARHSPADVRATAAGIREVRVAGRIASARSVLSAAGTRVSARMIPAAVGGSPR